MSVAQRAVLRENTAPSLDEAPKDIQMGHTANCTNADPAYGKGIADALKIPPGEVSA